MAFSPTAAVRDSSRRWMEGPLTTVIIDDDALGDLSSEIARAMMRPSGTGAAAAVTEWDAEGWHYDGSGYRGCESSRMERVALYVLSLDAINFCFWPDVEAGDGDGDGDGHCGAVAAKTTTTKTTTRNSLEYEHLAIALRKVAEADDENDDDENDDVENDVDVDVAVVRSGPSYALGPANLSTLTPSRLRSLLRPHFPSPTTGEEDVAAAVGGRYYDLPNVEVRCALLNELGRGLLDRHDGSALRMISKANGSADALVGIILDTFPGFRDYCVDASSIPASDGWEAAGGGGGRLGVDLALLQAGADRGGRPVGGAGPSPSRLDRISGRVVERLPDPDVPIRRHMPPDDFPRLPSAADTASDRHAAVRSAPGGDGGRQEDAGAGGGRRDLHPCGYGRRGRGYRAARQGGDT